MIADPAAKIARIDLPVSRIVHDRWTLHANAGLTPLFRVHVRNPTSYNLGGSAIFAATGNFNLMLEAVGEWSASVNGRSGIDRDRSAVLSPGARYAANLRAGQLVLGIGLPLALTKAAPDRSLILYVSFEHSFLKK